MCKINKLIQQINKGDINRDAVNEMKDSLSHQDYDTLRAAINDFECREIEKFIAGVGKDIEFIKKELVRIEGKVEKLETNHLKHVNARLDAIEFKIKGQLQ